MHYEYVRKDECIYELNAERMPDSFNLSESGSLSAVVRRSIGLSDRPTWMGLTGILTKQQA